MLGIDQLVRSIMLLHVDLCRLEASVHLLPLGILQQLLALVGLGKVVPCLALAMALLVEHFRGNDNHVDPTETTQPRLHSLAPFLGRGLRISRPRLCDPLLVIKLRILERLLQVRLANRWQQTVLLVRDVVVTMDRHWYRPSRTPSS